MRPDDFVAALREARASAILRTDRGDRVIPAMEAAVRGGFRIVEFTLTTPGAFEAIREFARRPGLIVGAGTVLRADEAEAARAAGASFLVSPVMDPLVITAATRLGMAIMPGALTPTEMLRAYWAGAPLQKLFPAPPNGPDFVRACLGPMPFLRIVPTSGVTREHAPAYLAAGAWAVGFTGPLFDPTEVAAGRFEAIEARARELLASVGSPSAPGA
jgi:2-dehydro-3-deoxyphosphogluconate aldolase/(4S)-4-hydroxy-2-oxoglutarate aldolase